jgi:RNA polymerase sigma-B factor
VSNNHEERSPNRKEWQYHLISNYQQSKSKKIAAKLVLSYNHIVAATARRLSRNRPDLYDDLYQVGQISLLRSLERYDQGHGSSFESFARKNMIGYMKNYLRDKAWNVPMPRWMKEKWFQVQQTIDDLTLKQERTPSVAEIAQHINLSEDMTEKLLVGQNSAHVASLDAPLSTDDGELTLSDLIGTEAKEFQSVETRIDFNKALSKLTKIEKWILHLNYMKGVSQRTIAHQLEVSQMTVSRMMKRALEKLRDSLMSSDPYLKA